MIKKLLAILLSYSISLSISAIPWQCALEKLKIKSILCAQAASRITARAISIETPLEKLRVAGAFVIIGGSLYGMLVCPDKLIGHNAQELEENYEHYPKIKPRTIGSLIEWYKTINSNQHYQQINCGILCLKQQFF